MPSLWLAAACPSLRHPPDAHRAHRYSQQQLRQTRRQRIRRHHCQQRQQTGQGTADAARLHSQRIQQWPALEAAGRAPVTRNPRPQTSKTSQPGYGPRILAAHRLSATRTLRRHCLRGLGHGFHSALQLRQHERTVLLFHDAFQQHKLRRLLRQLFPDDGPDVFGHGGRQPFSFGRHHRRRKHSPRTRRGWLRCRHREVAKRCVIGRRIINRYRSRL